VEVTELDLKNRLRLAQLACVAAWSDVEVAASERAAVVGLCDRLGLQGEWRAKVMGWLDHGPPDLNPDDIPAAYRGLFLSVVEEVFAADGKVDPMENETLVLLRELLG
jgi:tellurite resistance protein